MTVMLPALPLSDADELQLDLDRTACSSSSSPHRSVIQAKTILLAADGVAIHETARSLHVGSNSVRTWRGRFKTAGVEDVSPISLGPGSGSWLTERTVAAVVREAFHRVLDCGRTGPFGHA
jgi:hypothetical protein